MGMGDAVSWDYDCDGKADMAIFRPTDNSWWILKSSGGMISQHWGATGDIPVPGDYDGDGKADMAIFRPADGSWWILKSSGGMIGKHWGATGDKPNPIDGIRAY
jgi:hypothetical protein